MKENKISMMDYCFSTLVQFKSNETYVRADYIVSKGRRLVYKGSGTKLEERYV